MRVYIHEQSIEQAFPKFHGKFVFSVLVWYITFPGHLKLSASRQPVMKYRLTSPSKNKKELITVTEATEDSLHDALTDTMITKEVFSACVEKLAGDQRPLCLDVFAVGSYKLDHVIYPSVKIFLILGQKCWGLRKNNLIQHCPHSSSLRVRY